MGGAYFRVADAPRLRVACAEQEQSDGQPSELCATRTMAAPIDSVHGQGCTWEGLGVRCVWRSAWLWCGCLQPFMQVASERRLG